MGQWSNARVWEGCGQGGQGAGPSAMGVAAGAAVPGPQRLPETTLSQLPPPSHPCLM